MSQQQIIASQLRDIHLPAPIGLWPPAPGWWIVALLLLLVLGWGIRQLLRRRYLRTVPGAAAQQLQCAYRRWQLSGDAQAYVDSARVLLRKIALASDRRSAIAGLSGDAWLDWLRAASAATLSPPTQQFLGRGIYSPTQTVAVGTLHRELQQWIRRLHV